VPAAAQRGGRSTGITSHINVIETCGDELDRPSIRIRWGERITQMEDTQIEHPHYVAPDE
jgi:hypothetical protein